MSTIIDVILKIPLMSIAVVLLMILGLIVLSGNNKRKDMVRFVKGIVITVVLSILTFSSVVVLKYFSYLKIDIMQLGVYGTLFFAFVFAYFIVSRSMFDGRGVIPIKLPYPVKQLLLFLIAMGYLLTVDTGLELYWIVVAVLPLNILYHLHFVKFLDKVFSKLMKLNEKFDDKVMVNE